MTILRTLRWALGGLTAIIVIWAFIHVGVRTVGTWNLAERAVTITMLHYGGTEETRIIIEMIEEFEREHPHIRVNRMYAADYYSKLKTMFAAGTPPDLFYVNYNHLPQFAEMELLLNLEPYLARERQTGQSPWLDDFYPQVLQTFRYDGVSAGAGPLYGLPKDFTTTVMYVNLDLFEQAGVPVPYDGWTWEEYEEAMAKITALSDPGGEAGRIFGGVLVTEVPLLENIIWTHGGEYFGTDENGRIDFEDVRLDEPGAQAAMERIRRLRFDERTVFNATGIAQDAGQLFYTGKIGAIGPFGRWLTPRYRSIDAFDWDVVPVPHGPEKASAIFTVAAVISTDSDHPDEAFELLKFISGPDGQSINARLGLAIPSLQSVANSDAFLDPGRKPRHTQVFLDAIDYSRPTPHPPFEEFIRIVQQQTSQALQLGHITPAQAAEVIEARWLQELSSPLKQADYPPLRWDLVAGIGAAVTVAIMLGLVGWLWRTRPGRLARAEEWAGWLFISPWLLGFLAFTLGPMIVSLVLAVTRWTAMTPLGQARYVGFDNFTQLFRHDPTFLQSLWVTVYYTLLAVPLGQAAALAVALLMNSDVRGITIFRTIFFVPSVVTGVALATLWLWMFNTEYGLLNNALRPLLAPLGLRPPDWFGTDAHVWAIPAFVIMALWGVGSGMVLYLAGLKSIPESLREASLVDGAGPIRRFWNITVPMLSPLIFFNLVMGIIGSFQVFTQAYVMTEGGPGNATLFYVLNLYQQAFEFHNMGYASAMAWVLFILLLALTLLVFRWSRSWVYYEGLKR